MVFVIEYKCSVLPPDKGNVEITLLKSVCTNVCLFGALAVGDSVDGRSVPRLSVREGVIPILPSPSAKAEVFRKAENRTT